MKQSETPPRAPHMLRLLTKVSSPEKQYQVAALPRRNRLIFVPFRQAVLAAQTAQTPQSGVCHQSD